MGAWFGCCGWSACFKSECTGMKQLMPRYLVFTWFRLTALLMLVTLIVVLLIEWFLQLPHLTESYTSMRALIYALCLWPRNAYAILPFFLFFGSLWTYMRLQSRGEWLGLWLYGLSRRQVLAMMLCASCVLILLCAVLGEGLAPGLTIWAKAKKRSWTHQETLIVEPKGLWLSTDSGLVFIESIKGAQAQQAIWYASGQNQYNVFYAPLLKYQSGTWVAPKAQRLSFNSDIAHIDQLKAQPWPIRTTPDVLKWSLIKPEQLTLSRLHQVMRSQHQQYTFWRRVFYPLWLIIICGLSFLLWPLRNEPLHVSSWIWGLVLVLGVVGVDSMYGLLIQWFSPIWIAFFPCFIYSLLGIAWSVKGCVWSVWQRIFQTR